MIRLNPKNETVPREALEESGIAGCQRAYFLLEETLEGKEVLMIDGEGRAFATALKNMLGFSVPTVRSVVEAEDPDWSSVGIPDEVRVKTVWCPFEHPDEAIEASPRILPAPPARPDPAEEDAKREAAIRELGGDPNPAPPAADPVEIPVDPPNSGPEAA